MAKNILAWSKSANQFYREIGERLEGKPPRIYLGAEERAARANVVRLEGVWQGVESRWHDLHVEEMADTEKPVWDDVTIQIAKFVGRGLFKVVINPPDDVKDGFDLAVWIADLRNYFPQIQINLPPEFAATATEASQEFIDLAERDAEKERTRHRAEMREIKEYAAAYQGKIRTQETLHDALDAYVLWLHQEHQDVEGATTDTGLKQGERAVRVKKHVKDMPLSDFGMDEIHDLFEYWRKRPKQVNEQKGNGKPFSHSLCKNTITLIKHFIRWLHKEKSMPWKKPADLDLSERIKIVKDSDPKFRAATYSIEEVKTLWSYATTFERRLLLLALNFGASISETSTLAWKHIDGDYVKRLRPKTRVYGEFVIWPLTKQAMGERRAEGRVLLNGNGNPLHSKVKGKRSQQVKNAWDRLLKRVKKQHPNFQTMGFHGVRRTAIQFIRNESDGETAGVFACHGKPVPQDALLGLYSNPVFPRVFEAQEKVWAKLSSFMTDMGTDVMPRKFTPDTIREVRRLKRQGVKTKLIAAQFGMSVNQVNRYARVTTRPSKSTSRDEPPVVEMTLDSGS
jgi:integrase